MARALYLKKERSTTPAANTVDKLSNDDLTDIYPISKSLLIVLSTIDNSYRQFLCLTASFIITIKEFKTVRNIYHKYIEHNDFWKKSLYILPKKLKRHNE
jgi:hypothetical protein